GGDEYEQASFHIVPQESMTAPPPGLSAPSFQPAIPAADAADSTSLTSDGVQMTTIPTPILNVRCISAGSTAPAFCSSRNTAGTSQLDVSITASRFFGSARSRFSRSP